MKSTGAPLTRVALTVLVMVSMLAVFGTTATAKPPPKPDKEQVAVCHYDAAGLLDPSVPLWKLLLVNPKAVDRLLARGDGLPNEAVPGTDGDYVFDEYCVPQPVVGPTETIFAVAYSDMDTADGAYNADVDVLIAKLVDGNDNGVLDDGDKVILDSYPLYYVYSPPEIDFGTFGVTEYTIQLSDWDSDYYEVFYTVPSDVGLSYVSFLFEHNADYERYGEGATVGHVYIVDDLDGTGWTDAITVDATCLSLPSQPVTGWTGDNSVDNVFLDVDLYPAGLG